jgi:hypothetical protein
MPNRIAPIAWMLAVVTLWGSGLSCGGTPQVERAAGAAAGSGGSGNSAGTGAGLGGATGTGGSISPRAGSGPQIDVPIDDGGVEACVALSCTPAGGQYCGAVGNGCNATMNCPSCEGDWVCDKGLCKGGPSCVPRTSCTEGNTTYCGVIGDDCGSSLDCGECVAPETCGGSGIPNVCGDPACVPITCPLPTGQYCGVIGNGCGGALDCGECPLGAVCGGDGVAGICPGSTGAGGGCTGIQCDIETCPGGATTSISGIVYDPAGVNPLYNVWVYVPNAPLEPIPTGAVCAACTANLSGEPIATAMTDATGRFKLDGVPTGTNIPLVMQIGRWRRQIVIPTVTGCVDNPVNDPELLRLPRNQQEGHIPLIAITTGGYDALECIIPRIGLDASEVTTDTGTGRVHLYAGGSPGGQGRGATTLSPDVPLTEASALWSDPMKMRGYDIVMFSCEGGEDRPDKTDYVANLEDYANNGGRAFLSHFHYTFLTLSTAFQGTAEFSPGGDDPPDPSLGIINTTFPKGAALADWLVNVGATPVRGELMIHEPQATMRTPVAPTQDWISIPMNPEDDDLPALQYMTFNTPLGVPAEQQCGRIVDTDLHIGASVEEGGVTLGGDTSDPDVPYPGGCAATPMSPQTKALEFIFFDLSNCVQPDEEIPEPPPPPMMGTPPPPVPVPPPPPPPPPPR